MTATLITSRAGAVACAAGDRVSLWRVAPEGVVAVADVVVDRPVAWIAVAPGGAAVAGRDADHERAWLWRPGQAPRDLAFRTGTRDTFACGFICVAGEPLVAVAQSGRLRALDLDGSERFTAATDRPRSFFPHAFAELDGGRLAIVGSLFSDPCDTVVTVAIDKLVRDPGAIESALGARPPDPVSDRAVRLAVGAAPEGAAVVYRDPEEEEIPDDHDEADELPELWNFTGVYLRDLASGKLLQRIAYRGALSSGAPIIATARTVAIETHTGVDLVDRATALTDHVGGAAAALGREAACVVAVGHDGAWSVRRLDSRHP